MAEPKKKQTKTRTRRRRNQINAVAPNGIKCPQCKVVINRHQVCSSCGFYKGEKVR
ncbi:MAG: hypothetical protein ACD_83C00027G0001 [uncultured bacterium]|nr:MAG: hypothetical protein ACD_83C00027G0001 [uncultured bacterium]